MSGISIADTIKGSISAECALSGKLSCSGGLAGKLTIAKEYDAYTGEYEVAPYAFHARTLNTANRLLSNDIVVTEIPCYETSNNSNGTTVYIAKEV